MNPFRKGDKIFIIRELSEERYGGGRGPGANEKMKLWVNNFGLNLSVVEVYNDYRHSWIRIQNDDDNLESWTFLIDDVAFAEMRNKNVGDEVGLFRILKSSEYPKACTPLRIEGVKLPGVDEVIEVYQEGRNYCTHYKFVDGRYFDWRSFCPPDRITGEVQVDKKKKKVKKIKPKALSTELKEKCKGRCTCAFAIRWKDKVAWDGTDRYIDGHAPCHAAFKHNGHPVVEAVEWIKNHLDKIPEQNRQAYREYVYWILNDSPWAPVFKTKSLMIAFKNGVQYNVDKSQAELLSAAVALRVGSEFHSKDLIIWKWIKDQGFSGNTAWLIASMYSLKNGVLTYSGNSGGHHTIVSSQSKNSIISFFQGKGFNPDVCQGKMSEGKGKYAISEAIGKLNGAITIGDWLKSLVVVDKVDDGWGGKVDGPINKDVTKKFIASVENVLNGDKNAKVQEG